MASKRQLPVSVSTTSRLSAAKRQFGASRPYGLADDSEGTSGSGCGEGLASSSARSNEAEVSSTAVSGATAPTKANRRLEPVAAAGSLGDQAGISVSVQHHRQTVMLSFVGGSKRQSATISACSKAIHTHSSTVTDCREMQQSGLQSSINRLWSKKRDFGLAGPHAGHACHLPSATRWKPRPTTSVRP